MNEGLRPINCPIWRRYGQPEQFEDSPSSPGVWPCARCYTRQDMRVFLAKIVAGIVAIALLEPALMLAKDSNVTSWQNLKQLAAGQEIEVTKTEGRPVRGAFLGFVDQSISLREKQQEIAIPRADVARVQLRPAKRGRYLWIGAAVGAGAGAGVGLGIGEGVANESGGDFRNLKPAITGVSAGLGALVGAVIGSTIGGRHATIYMAR